MYVKYYLIADGGDGSSHLVWFDSEAEAEQQIENDPETFGMNDYVGEIKSASPIEVD